MGNAGRLERELDQIYIGNVKFYVSIPRYRRHEPEINREKRRDNKSLHMEMLRESRKRFKEASVINGKMRIKEVWVEKKGNKSFVDIVKGGSQQKWKGSTIKTQHQVLPWMKNSAIGQFSADLNFDQLGEEFVKGGMCMIKVRCMGDNLALLMPREGESMEDLIKLNKK